MSAEMLRRAATLMREDSDPRWQAVADGLEDIATRHAPDPEQVELVLHLEDPCEVCDDGGHLCTVCTGCYPSWEGMDGHTVYPCRETRAALDVAHAYLGGGVVTEHWTPTIEQLPQERRVVEALDRGGHVHRLKYHSNLWWLEDGSMYVDFVPQAWRYAS